MESQLMCAYHTIVKSCATNYTSPVEYHATPFLKGEALGLRHPIPQKLVLLFQVIAAVLKFLYLVAFLIVLRLGYSIMLYNKDWSALSQEVRYSACLCVCVCMCVCVPARLFYHFVSEIDYPLIDMESFFYMRRNRDFSNDPLLLACSFLVNLD